MRNIYVRTALAGIAAVVVSLGLYIFVTESPYVLAVGLALGCYLAQVSTVRSGMLLGWVASCPLAFYRVWTGFMPADSNEAAIVLDAFILIVFGAIYGGLITWLIQSLKHGKVYFS